MVYLALVCLLLAAFLLWQAARQRRVAGLPAGRVIYSDTRTWGKPERPLYDRLLDLTGRPDYLVSQRGMVLPVEVKSSRSPGVPYESHVFQLASYCYLVEKTWERRPAYGVLHYRDRTYAIDYTVELESALMELLAEIRRDEARGRVDRSHEQAGRCAACGFREMCDQSLA